ncbi:hypothetical protein PanWU01x14_034530 [Parasponia andersonii]|uniref:Uncharacterized protein n=1 Tax=Parasponia andersonii TaxID=3476 RepID=A0A2P5DT02_PARAD|nr:hypothetical protein PanWU01x14_034530 [Parasponia andersonii]
MENEYRKKKKDEMLKMKAVVMECGKDQWAQFSQSARQCRARCYESLAPSIDEAALKGAANFSFKNYNTSRDVNVG